MKFPAALVNVACFLAAFLFPIQAPAVMQLMPPVQEVTVQRGYTSEFTITVVNNGDEDSPSKFSVHDLDISIEGAPFISDSGWARGCGAWIALDPEECIIKPHESLTLKGTISVPKTAEGGYYAAVKGSFVTTNIPLEAEKVNIKGSAISLLSEALVVVLFTVPSSRNRPILRPDTLLVYPSGEESEDVGFQPKSKKGWKVVLPVRNEGNIHTRASGQVSIWSESGARLGSAPLKAGKGYVLPDRVRNFTAEGDNALSDGYYMIRLTLQTSERASWTNSLPFAVYEGEVYPGAITDELAELIRSASPGFSLKETFIQKKITPGGSTYVPVQMVNTVDDTLVLYPRKLEWTLTPIGQPMLGKDDSIQPRSCTPWIEFVEKEVVLLPGRRGFFKLKVNSPENISGEYYSAIVFDLDPQQKDLPAEFMAARTQLIALQTPKDLDYQIEVDSIEVKKESAPELTLFRFLFKVRNTGNTHCFAAGSMSMERQVAPGVYKAVGTAKDFGDRQTYLLPGGERTFEIDIPDLEPGTYRVILAANYWTETQPVMRYQKFVIE